MQRQCLKVRSEEKLRDILKLTCLSEDKMLSGSSQDESIFLTIEVVKNIESKHVKIDENIESPSLKELDCKEHSHEVNIKSNKSQDELHNLGNCDSIQTIDIGKNSEKKKENEVEKQHSEDELNDTLKLKCLNEDKMLAGSSQNESVFDTKAVFTPVVGHLMKDAEEEATSKMVEQLNQDVKIDENIRTHSLKQLDFQCYSYEVNTKLNNSHDDMLDFGYCDSNETKIGTNLEENKEYEIEKQSSEVLDMKASKEDTILAGSSQDESTIKTIVVLNPADQPLPNDIKIKAATEMLEDLKLHVKNIESQHAKIDENIRARSLKDLDFRGYSYEVNIKLYNSRDDLQNFGYFDSVETIDFGENSGENKEYAFRTRLRSPECQHRTGVPIPIQLPKPSQKLKNKSKTKKNKCKKVSKCCSFIMGCLF